MRLLRLFLGCLALAAGFAPSAWADDPEPTSPAGKEASRLLDAHGKAIEKDAVDEARAARAQLASLLKAGKDLGEVRFRYARALRQAADAYRAAKDTEAAARSRAALETLVAKAPKDDRLQGEWIVALWGLGRDRWQARALDEGRAYFAKARAIADAKDAGPATLDEWVWTLDGIHQLYDQARESEAAESILQEMRVIVDDRGATDVRVNEFLRSLVRQHERQLVRGAIDAATALLAEIRRRAARGEGKPPRWQLPRAIRNAHRYTLPVQRGPDADGFLAELRKASANEADRDARLEFIAALATAAYNEDEPLPFAQVTSLVEEGRPLLARTDAEPWDREQFMRLLRNASEQAAKLRQDEALDGWAAEGRKRAFAKDATSAERTQYGALLMDAIRVLYRQDRYAKARELLDGSRELAGRDDRTWQQLEQFTRNLVDVHLLAEDATGDDAARHRRELVAELEARSKDEDATPAVRLNLAQAYYNRHLYAHRRGETVDTSAALGAIRTLIAAYPDEPRLRQELLDMLVREHEKTTEADIHAGLAMLTEGRALADREDAPAGHRARYLDMLIEQIEHVSQSRTGEGLLDLMKEVRQRTSREDLSEPERRWLVAALRFMAHRSGRAKDRAQTDAFLEEARRIVARENSTPNQRSEFVRMLEIDARRHLEAGRLEDALAHNREIAAYAMRKEAAPYQYERAGWTFVTFQEAAYKAGKHAAAAPVFTLAEALRKQHPTSDDVVAAWIRMEGDRIFRLTEVGKLEAADVARDALRRAADALLDAGSRGRYTHEELAVVLDREVFRRSRESTVDLPTLVALAGEMRRRFGRDGVSPVARNELADTYLWLHGAYGEAERWEPARRTLDRLIALAEQEDATAHQRSRLLDVLEDEMWDARTRESVGDIEPLEAKGRAVALAFPGETRVQDMYTRILYVAHYVLGETDTHVSEGQQMLERLRWHVRSRENATPYQWEQLAHGLANATNYAQYDTNVEDALQVLEELRKLTKREKATEENFTALGYALAHLVRALEWPEDKQRVEDHLLELAAIVARPTANDRLREHLPKAYEYMAAALPIDAGDGWSMLLARTEALAAREDPTPRERAVHGHALGKRAAVYPKRTHEPWQAYEAWALRDGASHADHVAYVTSLGKAVRWAKAREDVEALTAFMQAFEAVVAVSKKPRELLRAFQAGA